MDRRVWFFGGGAVLAALLSFVALDELRYVPLIVSGVYVVLAAAVYLDWRSSEREHSRPRQRRSIPDGDESPV